MQSSANGFKSVHRPNKENETWKLDVKINKTKKTSTSNMVPHLIFYPVLEDEQFMSLSLMRFGDLIEHSRAWD